MSRTSGKETEKIGNDTINTLDDTTNDTTNVPVNDTINTVIGPVNVPVNKNNVPVNVPVNVPEINLSDKERQVLDFIIKKNNITAKEIAEKIGVSDKTVKRAISTLKTNGLIVRIGSDKKGFWSVKDCIKER